LRAHSIINLPLTNIGEVIDILLITFLQGFIKWLKFYLNLGAVTLLLLSVSFAYLRFKYNQLNGANCLRHGIAFSFFALLQCFVSRLADQLTYIAYWHYISALVCVFLSVYFFGIYVAYLCQKKHKNLKRSEINSILCMTVAVIFGAFAIILMAKEIHLHGQTWMHGPANLEGISDIENPTGWQMDCWIKLNDYRAVKMIRK
jgi:hypothetical protein